MDWTRAVEEVAWAGPSGLGRADLLERLSRLNPEYKMDDATGPMVWDRLCRMEDTEFLVQGAVYRTRYNFVLG